MTASFHLQPVVAVGSKMGRQQAHRRQNPRYIVVLDIMRPTDWQISAGAFAGEHRRPPGRPRRPRTGSSGSSVGGGDLRRLASSPAVRSCARPGSRASSANRRNVSHRGIPAPARRLTATVGARRPLARPWFGVLPSATCASDRGRRPCRQWPVRMLVMSTRPPGRLTSRLWTPAASSVRYRPAAHSW